MIRGGSEGQTVSEGQDWRTGSHAVLPRKGHSRKTGWCHSCRIRKTVLLLWSVMLIWQPKSIIKMLKYAAKNAWWYCHYTGCHLIRYKKFAIRGQANMATLLRKMFSVADWPAGLNRPERGQSPSGNLLHCAVSPCPRDPQVAKSGPECGIDACSILHVRYQN